MTEINRRQFIKASGYLSAIFPLSPEQDLGQVNVAQIVENPSLLEPICQVVAIAATRQAEAEIRKQGKPNHPTYISSDQIIAKSLEIYSHSAATTPAIWRLPQEHLTDESFIKLFRSSSAKDRLRQIKVSSLVSGLLASVSPNYKGEKTDIDLKLMPNIKDTFPGIDAQLQLAQANLQSFNHAALYIYPPSPDNPLAVNLADEQTFTTQIRFLDETLTAKSNSKKITEIDTFSTCLQLSEGNINVALAWASVYYKLKSRNNMSDGSFWKTADTDQSNLRLNEIQTNFVSMFADTSSPARGDFDTTINERGEIVLGDQTTSLIGGPYHRFEILRLGRLLGKQATRVFVLGEFFAGTSNHGIVKLSADMKALQSLSKVYS